MKKVPMITTERLSLCAIRDNDKEDMIALLTNEEIGKTFMVPDFKSREEEVKLFEVLKRLSESEKRFVYGIYLGDKLIGFINDVDSTLLHKPMDTVIGVEQVKTVVDEDAQGQQIMLWAELQKTVQQSRMKKSRTKSLIDLSQSTKYALRAEANT